MRKLIAPKPMTMLCVVRNFCSLSSSQARPLHRRGLLCILPKNRPIMVPIAGFLTKSTLFIIYLQFVHISSFFQIFPKPAHPTGKPGQPICSHSAHKCSSARGRPRKAVFPTGPRICEFFATSSGRLYAPHFSRNSNRRSGNRETASL